MTLTMTDIQLFQILKQKMGEKEAEALVEFVDNKLKQSNENNLKVLATKEDIGNLRVEIKETKTEMLKWFVGLFITLAIMIIGLYVKK